MSEWGERMANVWIPRRLSELVVADVADQRAAGDDGGYESWAEYVEACSYWEGRERLTSEYMERLSGGRVRQRRLHARMADLWFATASN